MQIIEVQTWKLLILGLCLTALVYWPGLSGGFLFDDYANIVHNERLKTDSLSAGELIEAGFFSYDDSLKRALPMLSFAMNLHFTGLDPFYFKLTNLVLHLVNGLLVYVLCLGLLSAARRRGLIQLSNGHVQAIVAVVALAWLLHPLNVSSVLYIVQRMAILATLFTMLGLIIYVYARIRMISGESRGTEIWIGLPLCTLLAAISKENGVLLIPLALLIEVMLFRFAGQTPGTRWSLFAFYAVFLLMPLVGIGLYTLVQPQWLVGGYAGRDFNLVERLMTQARVILLYLQQIILPNLTDMSLYHDTFETSRSLWSPKTTLPSIVIVIALIWFALQVRFRAVVFSLGILFFFIAHSIESTVIPLEIIFEHRNYLPGIGILLILFYYILHPGYAYHTLRIRWIGATAFVALFAVCTLIRADQWGDNLTLSLGEAERNPLSVRANFQAGREYASLSETAPDDIREELYYSARYYYERALQLEHGLVEGLIALLILDALNHKPVDEQILEQLRVQLAASRLDAIAITSFKALLGCQMHQRCSLPDKKINELISAVEDNPYLRDRYASILYIRITIYLWEHERDYAAALKFGEKAMLADNNNVQAHINYAHMLLALEEHAAAEYMIQRIRQSRYSLFYDSQLRRLEQQLPAQM